MLNCSQSYILVVIDSEFCLHIFYIYICYVLLLILNLMIHDSENQPSCSQIVSLLNYHVSNAKHFKTCLLENSFHYCYFPRKK